MADAVQRLFATLADRYRIERELGTGGMATVYLAEDLRHDRKVAIKVLKPELAAVLGAERFVQEIKTTAALSHPDILPLFDSGTADGANMMRATLARTPELAVTRREALFEDSYRHGDNKSVQYDVLPGGELLMLKESAATGTRPTVVLHWTGLLRKQRLEPK